ncbi:DUF3284 domain-containing protein [Enterococcus asini]|uniref:DUF3284 domain-containing protein n=1 Tax=Enterococcus asini TaxID=57732 RepID=UPI00288D8BF0|nr:DUF3284 domain-containing protein [Enterococcus asini]MDT2757213.1 DUF3284 domain-containing protein [Enterococcus asini]
MRLDTLNYHKRLNCDATSFFKVLEKEQLAYFQQKDTQLGQLTEGTQVRSALRTKMSQTPVASTMLVKRLVKNECFELETNYPGGTILQTYRLKEVEQGVAVTYSEKNILENGKNQLSMLLVLPLYKFFYNRNGKKRLQYLESLAQQVYN